MVNFFHQTKISSALLKRLHSRWANVAAVSVDGSRFFTTAEGHCPTIVHKRSLDILHDPWFNKVLPVMIDVGTNNEKLLQDPLYLGLQQHRLDGDEYITVIDEFMEAVFTRWPHVIVQFEDFQSKWAFKLLQRYRNEYRMFNDDVQMSTLTLGNSRSCTCWSFRSSQSTR